MRRSVQKWGNSLAVRLPAEVAQACRLEQGAAVEVVVEDGHIVISPAPPEPPRLKDLVARITKDNRHDATDFGPPRGEEVW